MESSHQARRPTVWDKDPHSGTCFPSTRCWGRTRTVNWCVETQNTHAFFISDPGKYPTEKWQHACIQQVPEACRGIDIMHRQHRCSTCVWYFRDFIICYTNTIVIPLLIIIIHSKQGQRWVRCARAHCVQIPEGPLGTPRRKQGIRTWFISSNFCLCCSFRSPNAFPPTK